MAAEHYFVFDEEFWKEGYFYHSLWENGSFSVPISKEQKQRHPVVQKGIYFSTELDSRQKETVWHRMRMDWNGGEEGRIFVSYFASDQKEFLYQGEKINLSAYLQDDTIDILEKLALMDSFCIEKKENPKDIFLFDAKGRYFWFQIEILTNGLVSPSIQKLRIDFPMDTIVKYLPEFYRTHSETFGFLRRFLGIYQAMIDDLNEQINGISHYFDANAVDGEWLEWLCMWVDLENPYLYTEEKQRQFIQNLFGIYTKKGTKEGILDMIKLYPGIRPILLETWEIMEIQERESGLYEDDFQILYGENRYSFFILIEEQDIKSRKEFLEMKRMVDLIKPAHTTASFILLKPFLILGQHSYLGLNSRISNHQVLELNGKAVLPFHTTILE